EQSQLPFTWVKASGGKIPDHAYYVNGKALGRGDLNDKWFHNMHTKGVHPGYVDEKGLIIEYGTKKILLPEYEVLVIVALEWVHITRTSELSTITPFIVGVEKENRCFLYFARKDNKIGKAGKHLSDFCFVDGYEKHNCEILVYKKKPLEN
ncbi:24873_t:CDS:2, partial [Dentiscutata erythropus]